jgi:hypothetical protein
MCICVYVSSSVCSEVIYVYVYIHVYMCYYVHSDTRNTHTLVARTVHCTTFFLYQGRLWPNGWPLSQLAVHSPRAIADRRQPPQENAAYL